MKHKPLSVFDFLLNMNGLNLHLTVKIVDKFFFRILCLSL